MWLTVGIFVAPVDDGFLVVHASGLVQVRPIPHYAENGFALKA